MKLIELYKELEPNKIFNQFDEFKDFFWEIDWDKSLSDEQKTCLKDKVKQEYVNEIMNMKNDYYKTDKISSEILVSSVIEYDENYGLQSGTVSKTSFKDILNISEEDLTKFSNPLMSISLADRKKILNLEVSEYCLNKYGKEKVAASILKELCFLGINYENSEIKKKKIVSKLKESIDKIELNPESCLSSEEVFGKLRDKYGFEDNRTEEEKEEEHNQSVENVKKIILDTIDSLKGTAMFYK